MRRGEGSVIEIWLCGLAIAETQSKIEACVRQGDKSNSPIRHAVSAGELGLRLFE